MLPGQEIGGRKVLKEAITTGRAAQTAEWPLRCQLLQVERVSARSALGNPTNTERETG